MIRAFLFDIGNVLLRFDFAPAIRQILTQSAVQDPLDALAKMDQIKAAFEDGQIARPAFLRATFDALGYRGTEADFVAAWENIFEVNEPMVALVERLHGKFPLFLLSNTSDIHREYVFRHYPVFQRFTAGVYSYEARASKPGEKIYEVAQTQLGLSPAETFFIDDLLPNIETARRLGFRSHHYHHERHAELLTELAPLLSESAIAGVSA